MFIRNTLEMVSTGFQPSFLTLGHYSLWYAASASCIILILHIATGEAVQRVARSVLCGCVVILLAPVLDIIVSGPGHAPMRYLTGTSRELLQSFFTFLVLVPGKSITIGMRVELAILFVLVALYLVAKRARPVALAAGILSIYAALFAFAILPSACAGLAELARAVFGIPLANVDERSIVRLLFLVGTLFTLLVLRAESKGNFDAIVRDLRLPSILYYVATFVLGFALSRRAGLRVQIVDHRIYGFLLVPLSLSGAALFSIVTNNLADRAIDAIAHPERPSVTGAIEIDRYKRIGWWALTFSLASAALAGPLALLLVGLIAGSYCLYSLEPFRLKRVPILSKLIIGANSLGAAMIGFTLYGGDPLRFPRQFAVFLLVPVSLASNFIDLADREGDRAAGIRTLPVMLGELWARIFVALACFTCYVWMCLILGKRSLLIPLLVAGAAHAGLVLWRRMRPRALVIAAVVAVLLLIVALSRV